MNMNDYIDLGNLNGLISPGWNDVMTNPYTVKGVDIGIDDHHDISVDGKTLKEAVEEAIKEILNKDEPKAAPHIEKYHVKHK